MSSIRPRIVVDGVGGEELVAHTSVMMITIIGVGVHKTHQKKKKQLCSLLSIGSQQSDSAGWVGGEGGGGLMH